LLIKSIPYAIAVFLMSLYTRIDGVMIMRMLADGPYEAGVYAAGYRILDALNMVAFLFAVLLLPMFSNVFSSISQLRSLLDEGFRYLWFLVVPVSVFGVFYRQEIIRSLYIQADAYWGHVFALLILNFVFMGMMYVFGTFLTAAGKIRSMNYIFLITVILNVVLNFVLIPKYRAAGAAIATLITQSFAVAGILYLSARVLTPVWSTSYLIRVGGFAVFCLILGWLVSRLGIHGWYWALCVFALFVTLGAVLIRIVRWKELSFLFHGRLNKS
jgi:O-antigen/teichoic acid export membrane protein